MEWKGEMKVGYFAQNSILLIIEVFHTSTCIKDTLKILFTENSNRYEIVISTSYLQQ